MTSVDTETVKAAVRETYGRIASEQRSSGCCGTSGCCGPGDEPNPTPSAIQRMNGGARPTERTWAWAGQSAGDRRTATRRAGPRPRQRRRIRCVPRGQAGGALRLGHRRRYDSRDDHEARGNVAKTDLRNVEFRLGEIEHLPVADQSVDAIMSNCVINLSTDKPAVFRDAFRVLAPGGRLAISDIVALSEIPAEVRNDLEAYAGCVSGAARIAEVDGMLRAAGFQHVSVDLKTNSDALVRGWSPCRDARGVRTDSRNQASRSRGPRVT